MRHPSWTATFVLPITFYLSSNQFESLHKQMAVWQIEGILPKGPYLPCVSMEDRALLAGYHRNIPCSLLICVWCGNVIATRCIISTIHILLEPGIPYLSTTTDHRMNYKRPASLQRTYRVGRKQGICDKHPDSIWICRLTSLENFTVEIRRS